MPNYWYTLTNTRNKTQARLLIYVPQGENIMSAIFQDKLLSKRNQRFDKIFREYTGNMEDTLAIHEYLPSELKVFASDHDAMKSQLASVYEILTKYKFTHIELAPDCNGCIYDLPGQSEHMDCISGCLHSPDFCYKCN